MATYLPVRSLNRSQQVRVGTTKLTPDTTSYVDITDGAVKRDLQRHSAIGAVVVVGGLTGSNTDAVVNTGAVVDQGTSAADLILGVSAGEIRVRSTGAVVAVAANNAVVTLTAADATNGRLDLVVADTTSGVVTAVAGTPAATPVLPSTPAGKVALARVTVAANATGIANAAITDIRPRP
jgi:hypothetical protein